MDEETEQPIFNYSGTIYVRPCGRGICLTDLPDEPHHRDALRREAADEIERLTAAYRYSEAHAMRLMNERDAATSAERDCRTCTNWTPHHRSDVMHCSAALRCVSGSSYQRHGVVQLWEAAPVPTK